MIADNEDEVESNPRPPKKIRTSGPIPKAGPIRNNAKEGIFTRGSIVRIKLKNFVTYDECEFFPGSQLNVIVGPNGSGKSSIVCGICIGLAGATSLLGRAKDLSEFIKHGKDSAMTEIELYKNGPGENIIIRRDIKKDNTSDFRVNGDKVPHKKVLQIIRDMNIQVDNLVQFLPQDRVCKFAELRPNELLIETEKAVGSQEMLELHNRLIELRTKQKNVKCHM